LWSKRLRLKSSRTTAQAGVEEERRRRGGEEERRRRGREEDPRLGLYKTPAFLLPAHNLVEDLGRLPTHTHC